MKLTKYEHACFTVEREGQILVVDPGNFTHDFVVTENIVAIVITHEHGDHFDSEILAEIYNKNPDSVLIALSSIVELMPDYPSKTVQAGDIVNIGSFSLEFFGGQHALIHNSIPAIQNLGVFINDHIYYPGDSFSLPNKPVAVLALPAAAPWSKISESIDFLMAVKPKFAFPTHDAILSDTGKSLVDRLLSQTATRNDIDYERVDGTTIDV